VVGLGVVGVEEPDDMTRVMSAFVNHGISPAA